MGYFEAITNSYFKKTDAGKYIFYPWGIVGKGYVLPSEEKALNVRKTLNRVGILSFVLILATVFLTRLLGWHVAGGFLLVYCFIYYIFIQTLIRGLEVSNEKMTFSESQLSMASKFSFFDIIFLLIGSLVFAFAGLWILLHNKGFWIGLSGILFFGWGSIFFAKMLHKKWNSMD